MSVGLYLKGRSRAKHSRAEQWMEEIDTWLDTHGGEPYQGARRGRSEDGKRTLFVNLHPAAEEVEFRLLSPSRLLVSANTSGAGPGLHFHLCDLLRQLGAEMGVDWEPPAEDESGDETGYFHGGNPDAVVEEMLLWLQTTARVAADVLVEEFGRMRLAMPIGHDYPEHGPVLTCLGPRDVAWLKAVADDPKNGTDFFAWWQPGLDAEFHRRRALVEMWQKVRWSPPRTEDEEDILLGLESDLRRAHQLDPSLDYPWREWAEVRGLLDVAETDADAVVRERAARVPEGPRVGYRRGAVEVSLSDGWEVTIPGAMTEQWDEDDPELWSAWDEERTVWFKCYGITREEQPMPAEEILEVTGETLPEGEAVAHRNGDLVGRGVLAPPEEEDGKPMLSLRAFSAVEGRAAMCNIFYEDAADSPWALKTWHSLKHS